MAIIERSACPASGVLLMHHRLTGFLLLATDTVHRNEKQPTGMASRILVLHLFTSHICARSIYFFTREFDMDQEMMR